MFYIRFKYVEARQKKKKKKSWRNDDASRPEMTGKNNKQKN